MKRLVTLDVSGALVCPWHGALAAATIHITERFVEAQESR